MKTLLRREKLLARPSQYPLFFVWIVLAFFLKIMLLAGGYTFAIYMVWTVLFIKMGSQFEQDRLVKSLKYYKSLPLDMADLVRARYIFLVTYIIRTFYLVLGLSIFADLVRNISYEPSLNLFHTIYILAMAISLSLGFIPSLYNRLLTESDYPSLPYVYTVANTILINIIFQIVERNLRSGPLDRISFQGHHYLIMLLLAAISSYTSYLLSVKILKNGQL